MWGFTVSFFCDSWELVIVVPPFLLFPLSAAPYLSFLRWLPRHFRMQISARKFLTWGWYFLEGPHNSSICIHLRATYFSPSLQVIISTLGCSMVMLVYMRNFVSYWGDQICGSATEMRDDIDGGEGLILFFFHVSLRELNIVFFLFFFCFFFFFVADFYNGPGTFSSLYEGEFDFLLLCW